MSMEDVICNKVVILKFSGRCERGDSLEVKSVFIPRKILSIIFARIHKSQATSHLPHKANDSYVMQNNLELLNQKRNYLNKTKYNPKHFFFF